MILDRNKVPIFFIENWIFDLKTAQYILQIFLIHNLDIIFSSQMLSEHF